MLSRWDRDDHAAGVRDAISLAAKAGVSFLKDGIQLTMNLYNVKSRPPKPPAKQAKESQESGDRDDS